MLHPKTNVRHDLLCSDDMQALKSAGFGRQLLRSMRSLKPLTIATKRIYGRTLTRRKRSLFPLVSFSPSRRIVKRIEVPAVISFAYLNLARSCDPYGGFLGQASPDVRVSCAVTQISQFIVTTSSSRRRKMARKTNPKNSAQW